MYAAFAGVMVWSDVGGHMSFLFRKRPSEQISTKPTVYRRRDNLGIHIRLLSEADTYWSARQQDSSLKEPFVLFTFPGMSTAYEAFLELPCIHHTKDAGLICTEVLYYGMYSDERGSYEVFIAGHDLSHELWDQARAGFIKHGGTIKGDLEPTRYQKDIPVKEGGNKAKVRFVRTEQQRRVYVLTRKYYSAPSVADAIAFLKVQNVKRPHYYIVVQTPRGDYGRDIEGIYRDPMS